MMQNNCFSFSIVIPTYNEVTYISNCLDSIINQNYDLNKIEIIIVDGNSGDGTIEVLNNYKDRVPNIKLLHNPVRLTPVSLNIGIKASSGEVVVILGAHTSLDKDFIKYNNQFMHERNVQVTGGTQLNVGSTFIQKLIGLVMEIPFAMASASYRWSKSEKYVDTVVYAAYRKEIFEQVGYFDENSRISEDAEFNWRIRRAGYKIFYSPKIKSYYYPRNSLLKFIIQMFRYGILRVNVVKKHIDSLKIVHLIPPIFVVTFLVLIILGFFDTIFFNALFLFLILYFLAGFVTTLVKIFPKNSKFLFLIPPVIFMLHFSWGTGFLAGLILSNKKKVK
jgi:cellulose synthase/poly-beta-1,6-N-acetylglucosamine synthase-like glycosyltransferase